MHGDDDSAAAAQSGARASASDAGADRGGADPSAEAAAADQYATPSRDAGPASSSYGLDPGSAPRLLATAAGLGALAGALVAGGGAIAPTLFDGSGWGWNTGGALGGLAIGLMAGGIGAVIGAVVGIVICLASIGVVRVFAAAGLQGPRIRRVLATGASVVVVEVALLGLNAGFFLGATAASPWGTGDRWGEILRTLVIALPLPILAAGFAVVGIDVAERRPSGAGGDAGHPAAERRVRGRLGVVALAVVLLVAPVVVFGAFTVLPAAAFEMPELAPSSVHIVYPLGFWLVVAAAVVFALVVAVVAARRGVSEARRMRGPAPLVPLAVTSAAVSLSFAVIAVLMPVVTPVYTGDPYSTAPNYGEQPTDDLPGTAQVPSEVQEPSDEFSPQTAESGTLSVGEAVVAAAGPGVVWDFRRVPSGTDVGTTPGGTDVGSTPGADATTSQPGGTEPGGTEPVVDSFDCLDDGVGYLIQDARFTAGAGETAAAVADRIAAELLRLGYEGGPLSDGGDQYFTGSGTLPVEWLSITYSRDGSGAAPMSASVYARSVCVVP